MGSSNIATISETIRGHVKSIQSDLPNLLVKVDKDDEVTAHLLRRLQVATDHALGCVTLAEVSLPAAMMPIVRTLFENFISTYWASLRDDNGQLVLDAAKRETLRVVKLNLTKGRACIQDKETGENKTAQFLRDPKLSDAQRLPRFDHMADGAGVRKIYDQIYGVLSLLSHASGVDMLLSSEPTMMAYTNLSTVSACLRCIHHILLARVFERRTLSHSEIEAVIKTPLT